MRRTPMDGGLMSILVIAAPIVLALALAYGLMKWSNRSRNPALKRARDQATHDLYNGDDRM